MALQSSCINREDLSGRVFYNVFCSRHNHIKKTSRDAGDRKSLYTCSIHIIIQIVRMFWRKSNRQTLKTKGAGIVVYYFTLILHHYDAEEILTTGNNRNFSLKKEPTFRDTTTGLPAKWSLRNDCRNSILMTCHYPDLGSTPDWLIICFIQSEALPRSG